MGTKKTEEIKYYYTWKGLNKWYYGGRAEYEKAQTAAKKEMGLKNINPPGFEYKEEAEAFSKGEWDKYILDKYKPFEAAQYDAVIYTDGSYDKDNKIASYGIIIFFRDETDPLIESGILEDVEDGKYKIVRYDKEGKKIEPEEIYPFKSKSGKSGFISDAGSAAGEFFGAMRSLEICCEKRGLKNILIVYDNENVKKEYDIRNRSDKDDGGVVTAYRKCLQKVKEDFLKDHDLQFIKVDSHSNKTKNKHQYRIDANEYPHAVYNDLVDILAKAETGIVIRKGEDFNVFRALSDEFKGFSDVGANTPDKRRKHARGLVKTVLKKSGEVFRPIFKKNGLMTVPKNIHNDLWDA